MKGRVINTTYFLSTLLLCIVSCTKETIVERVIEDQEPELWILATGYGGLSEFDIPVPYLLPNWGPFNLNNFDSVGVSLTVEVLESDTAGLRWLLGLGSPFFPCVPYLFAETDTTSPADYSITFPISDFPYPNEQLMCLSAQNGRIRVSNFSIYAWEKP